MTRSPLNVPITAGDDEHDIATCDLIKSLDANPRFRRDSFLGGIFHIGRISYREISATDSLHVLITGDRVSAHVDDVSPLVVRPDGSCRYAWGRVVTHNLLVMLGDVARRLRGEHGRQRCNLRCEAESIDDDSPDAAEAACPDSYHRPGDGDDPGGVAGLSPR